MGICHSKPQGAHLNTNPENGAPSAVAAAAASAPHLPHAATVSASISVVEKPSAVARNHVAPHPNPSKATSRQSQEESVEAGDIAALNAHQKPQRKFERSHSLVPQKTTPPTFVKPAKTGLDIGSSKQQEARDTSPTPEVKPPQTHVRHMSLKPEIQRSGSETQLSPGDPTLKTKRRKKRPASVALDVILRDERARLGFFKFIQAAALQERLKVEHETSEAEDSLNERPHSVRKNTRSTSDYREDCVLFWLEINDLLKIPSGGTGSFQLGLMLDLFEVYIDKGAQRELPMVSAAERETLSQYLQDRNLERALLSYKMLLLDVLEVVTSTFDEFVRDEGRLGYNHATRVGTVRNVLARLAKMNVGHHQSDRRSHLHGIISTPVLCRMFREFLEDRNSVESLLFIIDALAFEDLVNTFEQEPSLQPDQDGSHQDYCLRQAQKIFNKYVRYGSKAEICLSAAVKEKLLQEIVEYPLGSELFNEAVLLCSAELANSHLDMFYRSQPYLEYQTALRRGSVAPHRRNSVQLNQPVSLHPSLTASANAITVPGLVAVGISPNTRLPSLSEILNGTGVNYFRDFLKEEGIENMLFFYKEVGEFQRLPHGQKHYIQNKARKIFEKFVRRGGKLEVELPVEIRRDILWKLAAPTESTFTDAQRYIFSVWEHKYLEKFRTHALYAEMMAATPTSNARDGRRGSGTNASDITSSSSPSGVATATITGSEWVDVTKITLREFLDVEFLRRFFRLFLEKEQCANELYFYFEIAHFQQFPTSDYLTRQAKKLFNRFCDPSSREYVTLSDSIRRDIEESLAQARPAMFNKAQEEILSFFTSTLFPKFQQSEVYEMIRITPQEMRAAKLSAIGAATRRDLTGGGRSGARGSAHAGSVSGEGGRNRSSVSGLTEEAVTVTMILENPDTRALFLFFAEEIFCTESIYFWLDCNEYKEIPHRSYLKLRAQKIFRKYIAGNAKLQVNLESALIRDIREHIDDPSRTLFLAAQRSITKMLERDTLPKFRRSKHFQPCLQVLRKAALDP